MWRVPPEVEVRLVRSHDEFAACGAMSREIWGAAERKVVRRELLLTMQHNGGLVHGAFLTDGTMVGFCFAFVGMRDGQLRLCSHQLGVSPAFRGSGIGIALKRAQQRDALRLGYELVTWTFDPLEARNAYINLHRLGCIARFYDRGHYGAMEDELNRGLPSDRFEAEWWPTSARMPGADRARPDRAVPRDAPVLLNTDQDQTPVLTAVNLRGNRQALIRVPTDFQAIKRSNMDLARRWRMESRAAFEGALAQGLAATDCTRDGWYVMERPAPASNRAAQGLPGSV